MRLKVEVLLSNKIIAKQESIIDFEDEVKSYWEKYPSSKEMIIYKDLETDRVFSKAENSLDNIDEDFSFLASKDKWLESKQGIPRINAQNKGLDEGGNTVWHNDGVFIKNPEVVYNMPTGFEVEDFKSKSCLIVGAGPSTNKYNWQNIEVDYRITMNQFYKNEDFLNTKFDIVCPGGRVDFNDRQFKNYIREHNPQIFIEPYFVKHNVQWFLNKHKNNIHYFVTRYCSKLGTSPRLLVLAILLGFKDIYFIGMDGYSKDMKAKHSFDGVDGAKDVSDYDLYRRQYTILYDYIFNDLFKIYPNVKLYNLGEGLEENMSTEITQKYMPLDRNIKKLMEL